MEPPQISIVIVTWNSADVVGPCLVSLEAHAPRRPWEAVVVDNASTDDTVALTRTSAPWAHVVANSTNRGLAAAINQGLVASRGEYLIVANPDVRLHEAAIDALCDLLDRRPEAAFAIPQLMQKDGQDQVSVGSLPRLREALGGSLVGRNDRAAGFWWRSWKHDEEFPIAHGQEACFAVRRQAAAHVGALNEAYPLDWEGIDWSARAREAGWEIWFCPRARITHLGGASIRKAPARWIVQSHVGMYQYFKARTRPAVRPFLWASIVARALVKLLAHSAGMSSYDRAHRRARLSKAR